MESGEIEDPKDIREESDRLPEAIVDRPTTGRYYECSFCKQGFSTAQALGGHMNIHRRDRARIRQQTLPLVPNNPDDNHPNSAFQLQHHMPNHPLYHFPPSEAMRNYHVHRPSSSWSTSGIRRTFHGDSPSVRVQRLDLNAEPSFQNPQARQLRDGEEMKDEEDGGLDLELRLGHEP